MKYRLTRNIQTPEYLMPSGTICSNENYMRCFETRGISLTYSEDFIISHPDWFEEVKEIEVKATGYNLHSGGRVTIDRFEVVVKNFNGSSAELERIIEKAI